MKPIESSIVIDRPLHEVFTFVANFENHPQWEKNFRTAHRVSPNSTGVGTAYRCDLSMPGMKVTSTVEITEYIPDRRIAFRGDHPASARPVGDMEFAETGASTTVTLHPRPEMHGVFKVMAPFMAGYVKRNTEEHLRMLKALLERDGAASE